MNDRWGSNQVLALAPDAASVTAGQKLTTATWTSDGATATAVWGLCQGSGRTPYQTIVDLSGAGSAGPAYKCSCPSRKFPCKHAIGLLLRWSAGTVPDAETPAGFATTWLDSRAKKTEAADETLAAPKKPKDPEQAARTAAARRARVDTGVAELLMWIDDQVAAGLAGADVNPYARFDPMAARLVDAQAPGLAGRVRRLPEVVAGSGEHGAGGVNWPRELLAELGSLWALGRAHQRLDDLEPPLADSVRRHVGYSVPRDSVLATPGVTDTWLCLGMLDAEEERLKTRRTWLFGRRTDRYALLLDFAPTGAPLPGRPPVGAVTDATLHFYPGAVAQRALVGSGNDLTVADAETAVDLPGLTARQARETLAHAVAADPWLTLVPVTIAGRLGAVAGSPVIIDDDGAAVALLVDEVWFTMVAISRGQQVAVFGELSRRGLTAMSMTVAGRVWAL